MSRLILEYFYFFCLSRLNGNNESGGLFLCALLILFYLLLAPNALQNIKEMLEHLVETVGLVDSFELGEHVLAELVDLEVVFMELDES